MKYHKHIIRSGAFCLSLLLASSLAGCTDEKTVDYTDDTAYPPPVVTLSSSPSIDEVAIGQTVTVAGSIASANGLRDMYVTVVRLGSDGYEEIDRNYRVIGQLDEFPENYDFSMDITVSQEDAAAILVRGTDIFTKTGSQYVRIEHLSGIPPKITADPAEIASVEINGEVSVEITITSTEGLQSVSYVLVHKSPYRELQAPVTVPVSGEFELDFTATLAVDSEDADAIAVKAMDTKGVSRTAYIEIKAITGIPEGRAYIFENVAMAAEWECWSGASPRPAASNLSLFSIEGVQIGGELKNAFSLSEASTASSGAIDIAFVNIWRNTNVGNSAFLNRLTNRGLTFVAPGRVNGGPVGRQLDVDWLGSLTRLNTNFKIIPAATATALNLDELFNAATGNWETYQALNQLSSFIAPYASGNDLRILHQRVQSNGTVQITSGTYIAMCTQEGKYGIIKVVTAADDSDAIDVDGKILDVTTGAGAAVDAADKTTSALYLGPGLAGFDYTGVAALYGRSCVLKIIVQK